MGGSGAQGFKKFCFVLGQGVSKFGMGVKINAGVAVRKNNNIPGCTYFTDINTSSTNSKSTRNMNNTSFFWLGVNPNLHPNLGSDHIDVFALSTTRGG